MPSFRFLHGTPRIASIREPGLASFLRLESGQKLVVDHQKTTVPDNPWGLGDESHFCGLETWVAF